MSEELKPCTFLSDDWCTAFDEPCSGDSCKEYERIKNRYGSLEKRNEELEAENGRLCPETWKDDLRAGFSECFRVLEIRGILIFKWSENQIKIGEVVNLSPIEPLFGQRHGETHWLVFMKPEKGIESK